MSTAAESVQEFVRVVETPAACPVCGRKVTTIEYETTHMQENPACREGLPDGFEYIEVSGSVSWQGRWRETPEKESK